jgi:hypothetical protein
MTLVSTVNPLDSRIRRGLAEPVPAGLEDPRLHIHVSDDGLPEVSDLRPSMDDP